MNKEKDINELVDEMFEICRNVLEESFEKAEKLKGKELEEFNKNAFDFLQNGLYPFAMACAKNLEKEGIKNED
ncbi:MAG: hypothetical protein IKP65_04800 [Alphaproteobacteria bacterium]|nr:hypothetical protein [Alphaproteobacteria bacterium]